MPVSSSHISKPAKKSTRLSGPKRGCVRQQLTYRQGLRHPYYPVSRDDRAALTPILKRGELGVVLCFLGNNGWRLFEPYFRTFSFSSFSSPPTPPHILSVYIHAQTLLNPHLLEPQRPPQTQTTRRPQASPSSYDSQQYSRFLHNWRLFRPRLESPQFRSGSVFWPGFLYSPIRFSWWPGRRNEYRFALGTLTLECLRPRAGSGWQWKNGYIWRTGAPDSAGRSRGCRNWVSFFFIG